MHLIFNFRCSRARESECATFITFAPLTQRLNPTPCSLTMPRAKGLGSECIYIGKWRVTREQLRGYIYTGNTGTGPQWSALRLQFRIYCQVVSKYITAKVLYRFSYYSYSLYTFFPFQVFVLWQLKRTTNFKFINQGKSRLVLGFGFPFAFFVNCIKTVGLAAAQSMTTLLSLWLKFYSIIYVKFD